MKYYYTFILVLLCTIVHSQDTIYVNKGTSYLIFEHDILGYGFGDTELFRGNVFENSLHLRSNKNIVNSFTSLLVTYGTPEETEYYFSYIKYVPTNTIKEYYDFRNINEKDEKVNGDSLILSNVKYNANKVLDTGDEIKTTGIKANDFAIYLRLIRSDDNYFYLKFAFDNNSSIAYTLDYSSYQYVQNYGTSFTKTKVTKTDVFPIYTTDIQAIQAYSKTYYVSAIPIYAISNNESLLVTFREQNGDRSYSVDIPSQILRNSKRF